MRMIVVLLGAVIVSITVPLIANADQDWSPVVTQQLEQSRQLYAREPSGRQKPKDQCQTNCDSTLLECHSRADKHPEVPRRKSIGNKCNENHRECSGACDRKYPS
jgi:hypothetical protein